MKHCPKCNRHWNVPAAKPKVICPYCEVQLVVGEAPLSCIEPFLDGGKLRLKRELRGKNLACWCPLDQPCHADVLLEIANKP